MRFLKRKLGVTSLTWVDKSDKGDTAGRATEFIGQWAQVIKMLHVVQVVQVVKVVKVVNDDVHLENIWFAWSKPSEYWDGPTKMWK